MNISADTTEKMTVELDLRTLTEDDLASLKRSDPFLYYSIPAVYEARLVNKDIDHAELLAAINSAPKRSCVVSRKTQLSTECHAEKVLEDLLDMDDETFMSLCQASDLLDVADFIGSDSDHKREK